MIATVAAVAGIWTAASIPAGCLIGRRLRQLEDQTMSYPDYDTPRLTGVLAEIYAERARQDAKWGEQNHPDGTGNKDQQRYAEFRRKWCQDAFGAGYGTWADVLAEEVAEAEAERDPARLRAELVQVAAVATAWCEAIDRRTTAGTEDTCRVVEVDGEPICVHGAGEMTDQGRAALAEVVAAAQRAAAAEQRFEVQRQQDTSTDAPWVHAYTEEIEDWKQRAQQAEAERDGAYRERAHLLAWLTTHYPAVMAPALDLDEAGWWLLYITAPTGQLSWHISPRDAGLLSHVQRVEPDDPRAKWDGHTTEQKYQRIAALTADLAQRCGPECAEAHTYAGRCEPTTTEA